MAHPPCADARCAARPRRSERARAAMRPGATRAWRPGDSCELGEIAAQRGGLAPAKRNGHVQLLEVLREHLAAELRLRGVEEAPYVGLELGRGEAGDALGQPSHAVLGIEAIHRVPVRLDEFPGDLARVHAHEHAARDERRVLRADLTVDQALDRKSTRLNSSHITNSY